MMKQKLPLFLLSFITLCLTGRSNDILPLINLGRTSLACISASSVNGARAMENKYYGVLDAFDDGENRHNNINYTYWMPDVNRDGEYVDVYFDVPVNITTIHVDGNVSYSVRLKTKSGREIDKEGKGILTFDAEIKHVKSLRLSFQIEQPPPSPENASIRVPKIGSNYPGMIRVNEIRILGEVPPGTAFTSGPPRILPTDKNVKLAADEAFSEWISRFSRGDFSTLRDTDDHAVFVYFIEEVPVFRVTIDKRDGSKKVETFSPETPLTGEKYIRPEAENRQ